MSTSFSHKSDSLSVTYRRTDELRPNPQNSRTHSKRKLKAIASSIRKLGLRNVIRIDESGNILAGHAIWEAAKMLGLETVPVVTLQGLTAEQKNLLGIADNRLAEMSEWNVEVLSVQLENLLTIEDLDITLSGFEMAEIDSLLLESRQQPSTEEVVDIGGGHAQVNQFGDLWKAGKHRLYCGNALNESSYQLLMANKKASLVITDPPYNIVIDGNATGKGAIRHREFSMASGEMSEYEFSSFLRTCLRLLAQHGL